MKEEEEKAISKVGTRWVRQWVITSQSSTAPGKNDSRDQETKAGNAEIEDNNNVDEISQEYWRVKVNMLRKCLKP